MGITTQALLYVLANCKAVVYDNDRCMVQQSLGRRGFWEFWCCLQKSAELDKYIQLLCEARKKKGLTEQQARDNLADINVFGTLMVLADDADGMVSGATSTTANTIRPALQVSWSVPVV